MTDTQQLSDAKRTLLNRYLRGNVVQARVGPPPITRRAPGEPIPMSFGQQQLWLVAQLAPDVPAYNECITVGLPGPLNVAALEQSFNEIVRRHETWRTTFALREGQPVQVIHPAPTLRLPVVDLRGLPEAERRARALALARDEAVRPFDLARGPLLRPTLMRLDEDDYRLFLTLHHIILDGVSIYKVFLPELAALYTAFTAGRPSPLPEPPIQYADFAVWQRRWLQSDVLEGHLAYWKQQLRGSPPILELPTDRPRPATQTFRGALHSITLSRSLIEALKALSRREGVTLFMTLVAAFKTLLYRYTGQEDILLGIASAGRKRAETEGLIGYFLNTLVLRTDLSGNPSFRDLLTRVREVTLEAYAHEDVPFEQLVAHLQPERDLSQNPLFQVLLSLEPPLPPLAHGWTLSQTDVDTDTAKFDLSLELDERPEGIIGRCEYSTDLFDAATIARLLEHWQVLLESVARDPGQRLGEVPLLTEAERHQLLVDWNDTTTEYPRERCVHDLFEEQAARTPEAVAVVLNDAQLTYGELNRRANQLAHYLQQLGVGPEVPVGLCMDRSLELVVGLLGILKAGGAYVPLDPAYPQERLAFMLRDAQVRVLLTQERLGALLPAARAHVVYLDAMGTTLADQCAENPHSGACAENLAYVMYTSGSTGRPKGVEVRHRSIVRLLCGVEYVHLDATQTLLHMAPISFDAATFEVWGALVHGARCVLCPERVPTPQDIGAVIHKHHVTTAWLTASLFNTVIDEAPGALRGLQQLLIGGEALSVAHVCRALDLLPATTIINGYGPTESTTFACCYPIPRPLPTTTRSIPIGRPIANTQVYILDGYGHPVPIGVVGELYIGGDGLARGYRHRPELTAATFLPHPFSSAPGARLYQTGDLARYRPDGTIEFVGRGDTQVKLRGFRIELGEIEAVLRQHPAVREAVVVMREDEPGVKRLLAYVVTEQEGEPPCSALRRFLKAQLPEYMLPAAFVQLPALPVTPSGKVDRNALPRPEWLRSERGVPYAAPRNPTEERLVRIWAQVLGREQVGIHDNFFDVGGHSLLAVQVIARLRDTFQLELCVRYLFDHPTIALLSEAIAQHQAGGVDLQERT